MKYILESCPINWEPSPIRETIRKAQMEGYHPSRLVLGHCEAGSLRRYLNDNFEESVPDSLTDTYYLGLKVQEIDQEQLIVVEGEKTIVNTKDDLPPSGNNQSPRWHDHDAIAEEEKIESELEFETVWDTAAIRKLIDDKSSIDRTPTFLFLGRHEAMLLRVHLNSAFGSEAVQSLKSLYYMGLEIIELETDRFLRTAGAKRVKMFKNSQGDRPKWKDIQLASMWSFQTS